MRSKSCSLLVTSTQLASRHERASSTSFADDFERRAISSPSVRAISDISSPERFQAFPDGAKVRPARAKTLRTCRSRTRRSCLRRTPGAQLLRHDKTEILERCECSVETLEHLVGTRITKGVDEELRVEDVRARGLAHGSMSGGVISTPNMERVPSTSALKHCQVERLLNRFRRRCCPQCPLRRPQLRQRQTVRSRHPPLANDWSLPCGAAGHEQVYLHIS